MAHLEGALEVAEASRAEAVARVKEEQGNLEALRQQAADESEAARKAAKDAAEALHAEVKEAHLAAHAAEAARDDMSELQGKLQKQVCGQE